MLLARANKYTQECDQVSSSGMAIKLWIGGCKAIQRFTVLLLTNWVSLVFVRNANRSRLQ